MKKLISALLIFAVLSIGNGFYAFSEVIEDMNEDILDYVPDMEESEVEEIGEEVPEAEPGDALCVGSKGESVKLMQEKLIDLGYLAGDADGIFGKQTEIAVMLFQERNDLEVTGVADEEFMEYLDDVDAEDLISEYEELDYDYAISDPENNAYGKVYFNARVLQEIPGDEYLALRVATKGAYEDVVYVTVVDNPLMEFPVGDRIVVYGTFDDMFSYHTTSGKPVSLLCIRADIVMEQ